MIVFLVAFGIAAYIAFCIFTDAMLEIYEGDEFGNTLLSMVWPLVWCMAIVLGIFKVIGWVISYFGHRLASRLERVVDRVWK